MKKVLGLDLGTTSIGWALVNQAENASEKSSIIKAGVRVNPLSSDEKDQFEKGKSITTNTERTLKRHARRNLQRFKLRRNSLIDVFLREHWINESTLLSEDGKGTTFQTLALRAKAVDSEVSLPELARIILLINKKRGYKSSRKANSTEEGHLFDEMDVAKELEKTGMTPAQYALERLKSGNKNIPTFYSSDLINEYEKIWAIQSRYYPDILTEEFKSKLAHSGRALATRLFHEIYDIYTSDNKGKDKKLKALTWRDNAVKGELTDKSVLAYVICDLRGEIEGASSYLGAISDRSKELAFNGMTIGQFLYGKLSEDRNFSTKNLVFYRQDYLNEFNRIWECQRKYHPELTDALKKEIRDEAVFYQRRLKSQKGLISFCEFEQKKITVEIEGKKCEKIQGCRVVPKSSLLFQEFKIWQRLNDTIIIDRETYNKRALSEEEKNILSKELSIKVKLKGAEALKLLGFNTRKFELNFKELEGNTTLAAIYGKCMEIVNLSGHGDYDISKMQFEKADRIIRDVFSGLGFETDFLSFNPLLEKKEYEQQRIFKLWHLLYSFDGDDSPTGDENLVGKISILCNLPKEYARIISTITFPDDYASLSHKAIRKILPFLMEGNSYDQACAYAGYNHSNSVTAEERDTKALLDTLPLIRKGDLRNPVVEKILNQMVNVTNCIAAEYGKPDEIHIEMARELKQTSAQREKASQTIADNTKQNAITESILKKEFGLKYVSKTDIIRYKLYKELEKNGFKTLYSGQYIRRDVLFSKDIDIEHIIPQALLFDDSFSNKTLEFRDINLKKGRMTAMDFVSSEYGETGSDEYKLRVEDLFIRGSISKAKRDKLLMHQEDIPADFVNRDLTNSQYIARKAKEMLESYVRVVMPTNGSITAKLREDWQLVDVMKEINFDKYEKLGLVEQVVRADGQSFKRIKDWSKRNDHRHHAMDAITIAFTKPSHIQILNNLNAASNQDSLFHNLKMKETVMNGTKRVFISPIPLEDFRDECKKALSNILVSFKAKNKVATRNLNITKASGRTTNKAIVLTPRGQLHKEQIYGKRRFYVTKEVSIGGKMTEDIISTVASRIEREALMARLLEYDGDPKKAFTGKNALSKNPVMLNGAPIPEKVKCVEFKEGFSIRKDISPDLSLDKVLDTRVRRILQQRLDEFGGDPKKAFSNLDVNPIWFNRDKGIALKKVTILEQFDLVALHDAKDKDGKRILDIQGKPVAADYVNLRNNHHVAIYEDTEGNYQEKVVPLFEALQRISVGLPVIDKTYHQDIGWRFVMSLKSNEMFVFPDKETGFYPDEIDLKDPENYPIISKHLFRVQKLSSMYYCFRHHFESTLDDNPELKGITWKRVKSLNSLHGVVKIRLDHAGRIISVGDYD